MRAARPPLLACLTICLASGRLGVAQDASEGSWPPHLARIKPRNSASQTLAVCGLLLRPARLPALMRDCTEYLLILAPPYRLCILQDVLIIQLLSAATCLALMFDSLR